MTRLLLDEMLAPVIAHQLRDRGADATAVVDSPWRGASDEHVLEAAASEGRVLVTANIRDFEQLARLWTARGRTQAGLLFISSKSSPPGRHRVARITGSLVARHEAQDWPAPGAFDFL